jgi:hypothetical protein
LGAHCWYASVKWREENGRPEVGSCSGSIRRRNAIGSIAMASASSSIALSNANVPIDSPGARIGQFATIASSTTLWPISMVSAAGGREC